MLIEPISAIPSWEGFEYQRHIALYVVLEYIREEIETNSQDNIKLHKLGIEGEEDFSIIKGDNYISLHQVKAGGVKLDDNDKASFILSALQYDATNAYFHITPDAVISLDFVEKTKKNIENLLLSLSKEVKTKEEFNEEIGLLEKYYGKKIKKGDILYEQEEAKYIVISNINSNTTKGSLYKILDFVCAGRKDKANIIKILPEVISELSLYKERLNGKCDSDIWEVFSVKFETPTLVIEHSCKTIEKILKKLKPEGSIFYNETYYRLIYDKLVILTQEVISAHNIRSKKTSCKLEFSEVLNMIMIDYKSESNTTEYHYFELIEIIKKTFINYPTSTRTDCVDNACVTCISNGECNLLNQITIILNKCDEDKKDFLYKLLLRTPRNNLPRDTVVNNLLITLLKKINYLKCYDSNVILAEKNGKFYRLTLDENENIEDFTEQLQKELSLHDLDRFMIYESDVLITDRLDKLDYIYNQNNFNVMGTNELKEIKGLTSDSIECQKINYNKSKVMRIISKERAEGELLKK